MLKAKHVLALAAALMMCGMTAACGGSGGDGDTSGGSGGSTANLVFWNGSYKTVDDTGVIATEEMCIRDRV